MTDRQAQLWLNGTVTNAVSAGLCTAGVTIENSTFTGNHDCPIQWGLQGERRNQEIGFGAGSWEFVFVNFGPSEGFLTTVTVTWITPLLVIEQ